MSKNNRRFMTASGILLLAVPLVLSHPHFRKSTSARLPGLEVKMEYTTLPWNPVHLAEVKDGFVFHCGYATLELVGDAKLGDKTIPAGKYVLRARAKDANTWTFFVAPPPADRNAPIDMAKAIDLLTKSSGGQSLHQHLSLDLVPGHGETDNMALIVLAWGDRQIEGRLAGFTAPKKM